LLLSRLDQEFACTVTQTSSPEAVTPYGSYDIGICTASFVFASIFQIDRSNGIAAQTYPEAAATPNTLALSFR
jgi:hypothetical protein